jgi:hypothetical protein
MIDSIQCKPRLRRWEAVDYLETVHGLPTTVATLAKLACVGGGPSFQKMGRVVLYPVVELDRWATGRISATRQHTSDSGALCEPADDRGVGDIPRQLEPIAT